MSKGKNTINFKINNIENENVNKTFYGGLIQTTFEKVMSILKKTSAILLSYDEQSLALDINYVIDRIQTNSLYSYNIDKEIKSKNFKSNKTIYDLKGICESLNEYSEHKQTYSSLSVYKNQFFFPNSNKNIINRDSKVKFKTVQNKDPIDRKSILSNVFNNKVKNANNNICYNSEYIQEEKVLDNEDIKYNTVNNFYSNNKAYENSNDCNINNSFNIDNKNDLSDENSLSPKIKLNKSNKRINFDTGYNTHNRNKNNNSSKVNFLNNPNKVTITESIISNLNTNNNFNNKINKNTNNLSIYNNTLHSKYNNIKDKLIYLDSINTEEFIKNNSDNCIMSYEFDIHKFYKDNKENSFNLLIDIASNKLNFFSITNKDILRSNEVENNLIEDLTLINKCKFRSFVEAIRLGYNKVHYHNEKHGADVYHTLFIIVNYSENFEKKMKFTRFETFTLLVAGLCHDLGHPGYNNNFHINSLSSFAVTYNDHSVLENYHASEAIKLLLNNDFNFLENLQKNDFKKFRKQFIECILATDMIYHTKLNTLIKNRLDSNNIVLGTNIDKLIPEDENMMEAHQDVLNFLLHTADIAHNAKNFDISKIWVYNLMEEFWNQGDAEKSMDIPVSFLCDRDTADIPKGQIGFLSYIIVPSFKILTNMFPNLIFYEHDIEKNIEKWTNYSQDGYIYINELIKEEDKFNGSLFNIYSNINTSNICKQNETEGKINKLSSNNNVQNNLIVNNADNISKISKKPKLIFETHFTSVNIDTESVFD